MTKKKFVKQLMALGLPRNRANSHATRCRYKGNSYAEYYAALAPVLRVRQAQHKLNVSMRMAAGYFLSGLARISSAMAKLITSAVAHTKAGETLLDYVKANAPQITERHPADALDAMVYGLDLANGPDMMAYAPNPHQDGLRASVVLVDEMDGLPSGKIYAQAMSACAGGGGHD